MLRPAVAPCHYLSRSRVPYFPFDFQLSTVNSPYRYNPSTFAGARCAHPVKVSRCAMRKRYSFFTFIFVTAILFTIVTLAHSRPKAASSKGLLSSPINSSTPPVRPSRCAQRDRQSHGRCKTQRSGCQPRRQIRLRPNLRKLRRRKPGTDGSTIDAST